MIKQGELRSARECEEELAGDEEWKKEDFYMHKKTEKVSE
jgi:hypothetical protein